MNARLAGAGDRDQRRVVEGPARARRPPRGPSPAPGQAAPARSRIVSRTVSGIPTRSNAVRSKLRGVDARRRSRAASPRGRTGCPRSARRAVARGRGRPRRSPRIAATISAIPAAVSGSSSTISAMPRAPPRLQRRHERVAAMKLVAAVGAPARERASSGSRRARWSSSSRVESSAQCTSSTTSSSDRSTAAIAAARRSPRRGAASPAPGQPAALDVRRQLREELCESSRAAAPSASAEMLEVRARRGSCRSPRRTAGTAARARPRCNRRRGPSIRADAPGRPAHWKAGSCRSPLPRRRRRAGRGPAAPPAARPRARQAAPLDESGLGRRRRGPRFEFSQRAAVNPRIRSAVSRLVLGSRGVNCKWRTVARARGRRRDRAASR